MTTEKTQAELQRIWDTCLLQYWRSAGTLGQLISDFEKQTGKLFLQCSLLRIPPRGFPWQIGVKVFTNQRLSKIDQRMWNMSPERDAALIEKLQTSKYTTSSQNTNPDSNIRKEQRAIKKNSDKIELETKNYMNRNQKTDWKTVK